MFARWSTSVQAKVAGGGAPGGEHDKTRSGDTRRRPVLEPTDRIAEIVFGLIMATTFTGTLSATAGREDVRTMLIGAVRCNLAWGLVDAVMYVVTTLTERGRNLRFLQQVRATTQPAVAQRLIGETLPEGLTRSLQPGEIDRLWARLQSLPSLPATAAAVARFAPVSMTSSIPSA